MRRCHATGRTSYVLFAYTWRALHHLAILPLLYPPADSQRACPFDRHVHLSFQQGHHHFPRPSALPLSCDTRKDRSSARSTLGLFELVVHPRLRTCAVHWQPSVIASSRRQHPSLSLPPRWADDRAYIRLDVAGPGRTESGTCKTLHIIWHVC